MTKTTLLKWCVGIIVAAAIVGAYFYPKYVAQVNVGAVSPSGTYNNGVGLSQINLQPLTLTSTSTYILNNGSADRAVEEVYAFCSGTGIGAGATGAGTANETLQISTSTLANVILDGNTNYMFNGTVSTTSSSFMASSTGSVQTASAVASLTSAAGVYIWPQGSYLTFNLNATNTNICSFTASWLPL